METRDELESGLWAQNPQGFRGFPSRTGYPLTPRQVDGRHAAFAQVAFNLVVVGESGRELGRDLGHGLKMQPAVSDGQRGPCHRLRGASEAEIWQTLRERYPDHEVS